jgi:dipeptidyl aminopeptidase/acylaminoacyl peptidase
LTQEAPFGSWASPISIDLLLKGGLDVGLPRWDGDDLYWTEVRPLEGGRQVVVKRGADGSITDATPAGFYSRTRVHEYGGLQYAVSDGVLWSSEFTDQRVYRIDPGAEPKPITPEGDVRHADFLYDRTRDRLFAVREDHTTGASEAVNTLVALDAAGKRDAITVMFGDDFYSSPALSPDGRRLAWLAWHHPNMPWDATELWLGELDSQGVVRSSRQIAGGASESIVQPRWSPSGELYFISDRSNWWNLYRARGEGDEPVCRKTADFATPQWGFGMSHYDFLGSDQILCIYWQSGASKLARVDLRTGVMTPVDLFYAELGNLQVNGRKAAMTAASPTLSKRVLVLDLDTGAEEVVRATSTVHIDPGYFSIPKAIEFPTERGLTAHAFFYAPKNKDFSAPSGTLPPLIVHCHGGPTSAVRPTYDLEKQYWTSRGMAIVDVNYGGSSGYGREYRERLNGQWGVVDVDDCVNAARYLAERGLVDRDRMAIAGGSAGGFTTLLALTQRDLFRAGASYYGVGDLVPFVTDTHKFESRYLVSLVGPYPERADLYRERSAVHFADRLNCPVILFQGLDDKVVPPRQSDEFVAACRAKGLPFAYLTFEGEGHGFRKAETLRRCWEAELYFYSRIFGFTPADRVEPVKIENF